ncbi:MAG: hypothetical protein ACSHXL_03215, partial [Bacteroidota bacterium]
IMYYKWKEEIPFYKEGEVVFQKDEELIHIIPTTTYQSIPKPKDKKYFFYLNYSIYYLLELEDKKP